MTDTLGYSVVIGERIPITVMADSWAWTCAGCGWAGLGLLSEQAAHREANHHIESHHPLWDRVTGLDIWWFAYVDDDEPESGWERSVTE